MHIPDGYLSPSTCAAAYAAAAPFWWVALRRVKAQLHTRFVPLVAVFAAFSFVIMMFNLPLPGGTTGHAAGIGISAVVLGPWAAILSISIALIIQALMFGDGGVLAIGANCFNMAVAGSLVAWAVYRSIAGRSAVDSTRRVVAAGLAGYAAINVAALLTAIEFGLQPMWFRDASGAPLYAPYPLSIAVPAMMIGHLTFAGLAELVVAAGVTRWLQKSDPALLARTAGIAVGGGELTPATSSRKLWAALAVLMVLTPLGTLAVGTAWGEWAPDDFASPEGRAQIASGSQGVAPPVEPPAGLQRLSSFWTAPIPDYAPAILKDERLGYVFSAMAGSGVIILVTLLVSWFGSLRGDRAH